jgi:hypothetical protein
MYFFLHREYSFYHGAKTYTHKIYRFKKYSLVASDPINDSVIIGVISDIWISNIKATVATSHQDSDFPHTQADYKGRMLGKENSVGYNLVKKIRI